jgi:hypothetical protein
MLARSYISALLRIHDDHPKITFTHPLTGKINVVPRKERHKPHRALGWMMMADGKSMGLYKTLQNKALQLSSAIYGSRMRQQYASLAYNCYYIAIIGYTLPATKCRSINAMQFKVQSYVLRGRHGRQ